MSLFFGWIFDSILMNRKDNAKVKFASKLPQKWPKIVNFWCKAVSSIVVSIYCSESDTTKYQIAVLDSTFLTSGVVQIITRLDSKHIRGSMNNYSLQEVQILPESLVTVTIDIRNWCCRNIRYMWTLNYSKVIDIVKEFDVLPVQVQFGLF